MNPAISESRHARMIRIALQRNVSRHVKSNTAAYYDRPTMKLLTFEGPKVFTRAGGPRQLLSFEGPRLLMTGVLRLFHYDTEVLVVDFDACRITDHGYSYYSMTTQANISGWLAELMRLKYIPWIPHDWWMWTRNWRDKRQVIRQGRKLNVEQEPDELFEEFRKEVPWLTKDCGYPRFSSESTWWFGWNKYVDRVAQAFWSSANTLSMHQNHRYFTYAWGDHPWGKNPTWPLPHHWVQRFIDGDAERRWRNRQKRNGRPCQPIY